MRIIHVNVIAWGRGAWLTAAMAIAVTLAQPFDLATAQAEDPAEVQRRQQKTLRQFIDQGRGMAAHLKQQQIIFE